MTEVVIGTLKPYPNHPFKPYSAERLEALAESIRQNGLMQPIIIRRDKNAFWYIILSGHNRVAAMRLLGKEYIPAIIREMDDDAAALTVVNTNLEQREKLLPSERAFAYKIQMEAYKNKGLSHDCIENLSTGWTGDSSMMYYYIRLTELTPKLLDLVDGGRIPIKAGVELSYIDAQAQASVLRFLDSSGEKLSVRNASAVRSVFEIGKTITVENIPAILGKSEKACLPADCHISGKLLRRYAIPDGINLVEVICGLLEERFGKM